MCGMESQMGIDETTGEVFYGPITCTEIEDVQDGCLAEFSANKPAFEACNMCGGGDRCGYLEEFDWGNLLELKQDVLKIDTM